MPGDVPLWIKRRYYQQKSSVKKTKAQKGKKLVTTEDEIIKIPSINSKEGANALQVQQIENSKQESIPNVTEEVQQFPYAIPYEGCADWLALTICPPLLPPNNIPLMTDEVAFCLRILYRALCDELKKDRRVINKCNFSRNAFKYLMAFTSTYEPLETERRPAHIPWDNCKIFSRTQFLQLFAGIADQVPTLVTRRKDCILILAFPVRFDFNSINEKLTIHAPVRAFSTSSCHEIRTKDHRFYRMISKSVSQKKKNIQAIKKKNIQAVKKKLRKN